MRRQRGHALPAPNVPQLDRLVKRLRKSTAALGITHVDQKGKSLKTKSSTPHTTSTETKLTPETSKFDWGLKPHEKTKLVWPRNSTKASPVSADQRRRVLSSLAVAM